MNPIIRLLSGRPWPARLAITACCLLVIAAAAQFPFRTSYAQSGGRALVFDLGVASTQSEQSAKREQWEQQSRLILDCFRAINASAHRVSVLSNPLSDNLLSMSGVIYLLDDAAIDKERTESGMDTQDAAGEPGADPAEEARLKQQVAELARELELLSGGGGKQGSAEIEEARKRLEEARQQLLDVMGGRRDKVDEAKRLLEEFFGQQSLKGEDADQVRELHEKLLNEWMGKPTLTPDQMQQLHDELLQWSQSVDNDPLDQAAIERQLMLAQQASGFSDEELDKHLQAVREELEQAHGQIVELMPQGSSEREQVQLELRKTLLGLDSVAGLREAAIGQLQSEELSLAELQVDLQELHGHLGELHVKLRKVDPAELAREELELSRQLRGPSLQKLDDELALMKLDLAGELQTLQDIHLQDVELSLQQLEELHVALAELQLPNGVLLDATLVELAQQAADGNVPKISFRFQDHLFSFPASASPATMAKTVNRWLKENDYVCRVNVELCLDGNGVVCGAQAVIRR